MKKIMLSMGLVGLMAITVACGEESGSSAESEETTTEETNGTEEAEAEETSSSEEDPEASSGETVEDDEEAQVGEIVENEGGTFEMVSRTDDVGTYESGPIVMEIEKANGVSAQLNEEAAEFAESDEIEYIQVDMNVENTSEEDVTFYASQATLITDTGEQLEPDMLFSEHIDGEFLGAVSKSGSSFYMLENGAAEDVQSIELRYSAPSDSDYEDIGEEITVETELEK